MLWKNVRLVFFREVFDQLRDRRTLFMVAVLPLLLYPLLAIAMVQMTVSFEEQRRTVLLVNAQELPKVPLLDESGDQFLQGYFRYSDDAAKLRVVRDDLLPASESARDDSLKTFLGEIQSQMPPITRLGQIEGELKELENAESAGTATEDQKQQLAKLDAELEALQRDLGTWFGTAPCEVLIVLPEGFAQQVNGAVKAGEAAGSPPRPIVLHNSADEKSQIAFERVREALRAWERAILTQRLQQAGLPQSLPYPVDPRAVDLAKPDELAANIWSKIFPTLLVLMAVTGAFYPAIDLGAGEKERGTMETLLISPATRTEIVLGKFFTVMLFSMSTALLNLGSMGFTGKHMLGMVGRTAAGPIGNVAFPPFSSLIWVFLLAIPISALFSALSLAFAMFARSSKEGQYYLTPLLMVTLMLTMVCLSPAIELTPYYSVLPVVGPALLLKSLLLAGTESGVLWSYGLTVVTTSVIYSLMALWWAIELFQREDILFREAEKFDLGLWVKHLLRDKEPTPSFSEAAVCFVLIALLQFGFLTTMQSAAGALDGPVRMLQMQLIYLVATVGAPAVFMALLLTTRPLLTLKLKWPGWKMIAAGIALPIALTPVTLELISRMEWFFPPTPAGAEKLLEAMALDSVPLWLALSAFALAPAVCEELAFRGFIFTGLQRSRHKWLPIVISSILFGIIHLIPKQVFNAALLGLVIGLLAQRSGSLIPGVIFHAIFNGLQVLATRVPAQSLDSDLGRFLFVSEVVEGHAVVRGSLPLLAMSGLASALLIGWLINVGRLAGQADAVNTRLHPFENEPDAVVRA